MQIEETAIRKVKVHRGIMEGMKEEIRTENQREHTMITRIQGGQLETHIHRAGTEVAAGRMEVHAARWKKTENHRAETVPGPGKVITGAVLLQEAEVRLAEVLHQKAGPLPLIAAAAVEASHLLQVAAAAEAGVHQGEKDKIY